MSPPLAPQKCHNCRRRRLVCDRALPTCQKCVHVGQQCLGYGKLFVWTESVASRGKRAGQTSFAPLEGSEAPKPQRPSKARPAQRASSLSPSLGSAVSPSSTISLLSQVSASSASSGALVRRRDAVGSRSLSPQPWDASSDSLTLHLLVDPVVQDFDATTRYYLHYYAERVTQDLVVYDLPNRNPFRDLVPLCQRHAFLQHVVVALSAVHQVSFLRSRGLPFGEKLLDALTEKQKAIVLIKHALEDLGPHNYGNVLTAVVFLINFALVDSGRDSWKAHVGAAGRLMAMLQPSAAASFPAGSGLLVPNDRRGSDSSIDALRDYVMSDCLTFFILGSTLGSWEGTGAAEVFGSLDVVSMLMRAEVNTYHSCPSAVMSAILRSSQLAAEMHRQDSEAAEGPSPAQMDVAWELMRELRSFDARLWAERITAACHGIGSAQAGDADALQYLQGREHMACAHRSAACAYLLVAAAEAFVGGSAGDGVDDPNQAAMTAEGIAADIYEHLAAISETDMLFKGSVWPTFIFGTLAEDPERREWVRRRLEKMWLTICPWGYVKTALTTLEALWSFRDGKQTSSMPSDLFNGAALDMDDPGRGWLSALQALNIHCLVV